MDKLEKKKIFTKKEALFLSKIRIIKKNLVHMHGFPLSLADEKLLAQPQYFGQYGEIKKILFNQKINPETNKKTFSVYITYENNFEAAFAILCVDSLLIEGKLIRAFFGTTKYCNYFLNNKNCPNFDKCSFLHQLVKDESIIIKPKTVFSYNDHLNLAKKIIKFNNPKTKFIVKASPKLSKTVFPNIDFIFLNDREKENYFNSSEISYIRSSYDHKEEENILKDNNSLNCKKNKLSNGLINNYSYSCIYRNNLKDNNSNIKLNSNSLNKINETNNILNDSNIEDKSLNYTEPFFLYDLLKQSISHILLAKPFFIQFENKIPLKKMEFDYLQKELIKNNSNIYILLDGCLDLINSEE